MTERTNTPAGRPLRCAIYTRKSHEEGLDQEFNSLDAQREAGEAYIDSQKLQGWRLLPERYDDGGFSGGSTERPALQRLLARRGGRQGRRDRRLQAGPPLALAAGLHQDHRGLQRARRQLRLGDPADQHHDSHGRMTLNILLTFAQYEREIIAERIRDKVAAAKRRGKYCGGVPILGYDVDQREKAAAGQCRGGQAGPVHLPPLHPAGLGQAAGAGTQRAGLPTKAWTTAKEQGARGRSAGTRPTFTGC